MRERHGTGFFFSDPDVHPSLESTVAERDGKVAGLMTGRETIEAFLVVDPELPPLKRWRVIKELVDDGLPRARALGMREAHIGIPVELNGYADLLLKLPGFYEEKRRRIVVNLDEVCKAAEPVKKPVYTAEWWYAAGKVGGHTFTLAAFALPEGKYRIHATVDDLAATETGMDPNHSSILGVEITSSQPLEIKRRKDQRIHEIDPFANATIRLFGREYTGIEVWWEHEAGEIDPDRGWTWLCLKNKDCGLMLYDLGDFRYGVRIDRFTRAITDVDWTLDSNLLRIDGYKVPLNVKDVQVKDEVLGITYTESRVTVHPSAPDTRQLFGFMERVLRIPTRMPDPLDQIFLKLKEWACGDPDATDLLQHMYVASQIADDIVDGDVAPEKLSNAVASILRILGLVVPANPFFRRNADSLIQTLSLVIDCWDRSNEWAKSEDQSLRVYAYAHREASIQYIRQVALICGGAAHASRVFREAVAYFHAPGRVKTFEAWENSLRG